MKFLLFNLCVGAALIFLFTANKSELEAGKKNPDKTFSQMITKAEAALSKAADTLKTDSLPKEKQKAKKTPEFDEKEEVALEETPEVEFEKLKPVEVANAAVPKAVLNPPLSPEVAKRRRKILGPSRPSDTLGDIQITDRENRQERLRELAENMELFSAELIAQ